MSQFGRFVEIGKQDIYSHHHLPMWQFRKIASFSSVDLYPLFSERPAVARAAFEAVMTLFAEKKLKMPQPFTIFGVGEIEDALRLLQSGRGSGKMTIEMRKNDLVRVSVFIVYIEIMQWLKWRHRLYSRPSLYTNLITIHHT